MKHDNTIRDAIDESLGSVRFTSSDMRAVLSRTSRQTAPRKAARKRNGFRPILAMAAVLVILTPAVLLALRIHGSPAADIKTFSAANFDAAQTTSQPTTVPNADPLLEAQPALSESEAIRIARSCFEEHCDTSVFTFEEYAVSAQYNETLAQYTVALRSLYDNGCAFSVTIASADGSILSFSDPAMATIPAYIRMDSSEVQAWYEKHGEYLFTWPLEIQQEFSRRYEGGLLRTPREGEKDEEYIQKQAFKFHDTLAGETSSSGSLYPMLYDGRAFADGQARYLIYVFAFDGETNAPLDTYLLVTMLAGDGSVESTEILPVSQLK